MRPCLRLLFLSLRSVKEVPVSFNLVPGGFFNMKVVNLGFKHFEEISFSASPNNLFKPHFETILMIRSKLNANF